MTKPIGPIGDHVVKKMKAWDGIVKHTNCSNDGIEFEKLDHHDGFDFDDKSDDKQLSKYVVPKVVAKV